MAIYVALGSNLGNRQANMEMALRMFMPLAKVDAVSALYESPPQAPAPPPPYLNAVCRVVTGLTPDGLMRHLQEIEHLIGRRPTPRWSPRPIDLDLILYDDQVVDTDELVVPHPRMLERDFVLRPLLDLDPEIKHPATGDALSNVLAQAESEGLVQVRGAGWHESREPARYLLGG